MRYSKTFLLVCLAFFLTELEIRPSDIEDDTLISVFILSAAIIEHSADFNYSKPMRECFCLIHKYETMDLFRFVSRLLIMNQHCGMTVQISRLSKSMLGDVANAACHPHNCGSRFHESRSDDRLMPCLR